MYIVEKVEASLGRDRPLCPRPLRRKATLYGTGLALQVKRRASTMSTLCRQGGDDEKDVDLCGPDDDSSDG